MDKKSRISSFVNTLIAEASLEAQQSLIVLQEKAIDSLKERILQNNINFIIYIYKCKQHLSL